MAETQAAPRGGKDSGCNFRLAYFRPASGLHEELQRLHAANLFSVVRQLRFGEKSGREVRGRGDPGPHWHPKYRM